MTEPAWSNIVVVQLLSWVWLFATPWTAACQASLFFTISWSLLKFMSIESLMPSNHLILCHPLFLLLSIFPSIRIFSNEGALRIRWRSTEASASASVRPVNIQGWFPLRLTGLISLLSKGLWRVFFSTIQKHQFFITQPSLWFNSRIPYMTPGKTTALHLLCTLFLMWCHCWSDERYQWVCGPEVGDPC